MAQQTVVWTVLPKARLAPLIDVPVDIPIPDVPILGGLLDPVNELLRGKLELSVLVSPRLGSDQPQAGDLSLGSDFPDFASWPTTLLGGEGPLGSPGPSFSVRFDGGPTVEAGFVGDGPDRARANRLWNALFPPSTRVKPFTFDNFTGKKAGSIEAAAVADFLRNVYVTVGTDDRFGAGGQLPKAKDLALPGVLGQLAGIMEDKEPPDRPPIFIDLDLELTVGPDGVEVGAGEVGTDGLPPIELPIPLPLPETLDPILRRRLSWQAVRSAYRQLRAAHLPGQPRPALPDLTKVKTQYDFHQMVSLLGEHHELLRRLGLVFDLELPVPRNLPPQSRLRLEVDWPSAAAGTASFSPWVAYSVEPTGFVVRPRDQSPEIRNGFLRLDDTSRFRVEQVDTDGGGLKALQLADNLTQRSDAMPEEAGLPALRSRGITVIRRLAEVDARESWEVAAAANQNLENGGGPSVDGEVTLFAEHLTAGYQVDVWDDKTRSWHSLCQRLVDYTFDNDPGATIAALLDEGYVEPVATQTGDGSLLIPGSLFTWTGWGLCARKPGLSAPVPDKASPRPPDAGDQPVPAANADVTDFGFTIVSNPLEGSLPRLRFGRTYRVRARTVDVTGKRVPLTQTLPELSAEATAPLTYGRFEPVPSPVVVLTEAPVEGESVERVVVRSDPTRPLSEASKRTSARHLVPAKTSQAMAEAHGMFDAGAKMRGDEAGYNIGKKEAGSLRTGAAFAGPENEYLLRPQGILSVPYLPDPVARGALLLGLPGAPRDTVVPGTNRIPFTGTWPEIVGFRVEVEVIKEDATPAPPAFDAALRVLRLQVREAETVPVRLSSALDAGDLPLMGMTQWVKATKPEQLPAFEARALQGRNWMLMPYTTLILVHAVQRPVTAPEISSLTTTRDAFGETFADVAASFTVHRRSTSKVELLAEWEDRLDDPKLPRDVPVPRQTNLGKVDVPPEPPVLAVDVDPDAPDGADAATPPPLALMAVHEFADTKHHRVKYKARGTSSFREYFPPSITDDPLNLTREGPFFKPPEASEETFLVDIPSSARPAAPSVLYGVPTFKWLRLPSQLHVSVVQPPEDGPRRPPAHPSVTSHRQGKGVRVYVERPWFSSGEGELLGVVFLKQPLFDENDPRKLLVTGWGADPLWNSPPPVAQLSTLSFPAAVKVEDGVVLEELPDLPVDQRVSVAGHEPLWDDDRKLWFFDIELDLGDTYFPFVRLALARYQPSSVVVGDKDVKLSRVVLTDFVQLAPERFLSVTAVTEQANRVSVEVRGFTGAREADATPGGTTVLAQVQTDTHPVFEAEWETEAVFELEPATAPGAGTVWRGVVEVGNDDLRRRLLVTEVEFFDRSALKLHPGGPGGAMRAVELAAPGARIVYAESVELVRDPVVEPPPS